MERVTEWRGEHAAVVNNHINYIDLLARYEDSGLEPCDYETMRHALERLEEMKKDWSELLHFIGGVGVDRIKELVNADKEGRLAVLPCGVDDTAWYADDYTGRVLMGYVSSYELLSGGAIYFGFTNVESDVEWVSIELPIEEFGKTVLQTCEEAEKALCKDKNAPATDMNVGHTEGGDIR